MMLPHKLNWLNEHERVREREGKRESDESRERER
jgi:hypothetical protein